MEEKKYSNNNPSGQNEELDFKRLFYLLLDHKWIILGVTCFFGFIGFLSGKLVTPVYEAKSLVQIEDQNTDVSGISQVAYKASSPLPILVEMEILKSRHSLKQTINALDLQTVITPQYLPIFGEYWAKLISQEPKLEIGPLKMKDGANPLYVKVINAKKGSFLVLDHKKRIVAKANQGDLVEYNGASFEVKSINAESGTVFKLSKRPFLSTVNWLRNNLELTQKGIETSRYAFLMQRKKNVGILELSYKDDSPKRAELILSELTKRFINLNITRSLESIDRSLEFLKKQLPEVDGRLGLAEKNLNNYQGGKGSVDLSFESKTLLESLLNLESKLNDLSFREFDILRNYTKNHPSYLALQEKRDDLLARKKTIQQEIAKLPKEERDIFRYKGPVDLNQKLYMGFLSKIQELKVVQASIVGNVRLLDDAQVVRQDVATPKSLIFFMTLLSGLVLSIVGVLIKYFMTKRLESPEEIEQLGIPVLATILESVDQKKIERKKGFRTKKESLLSLLNPEDTSVEAIRSLRTNLHFQMKDSEDKVLMITGPASGVGKSFVASNLALLTAQTGQKTLLIDGDLRQGNLGKSFCSDYPFGFGDYLKNTKDLADILQKDIIPGLDLISRGSIGMNPSELLLSSKLSVLFDWAKNEYQQIIIDTPPALPVADAFVLARYVTSTIIVGRYGHSSLQEVELICRNFARQKIPVKGFVFNGLVKSVNSAYGYNYNYQYSYKTSK